MQTSTRMLVRGWAEQCHSVPSPHVGEGQGEGWRRAPRANLLQRADSENQESWSGVCQASDWKQPQCLLYPPPCPSPTWGEGTLWHRSSHLSRCIRVRVSTCVHALALPRGRAESREAIQTQLISLQFVTRMSRDQPRRAAAPRPLRASCAGLRPPRASRARPRSPLPPRCA
jgi:hypothetical protein